MALWIFLGTLAIAGLCYGFYRFGRARGRLSPGFQDRLPARDRVLPKPRVTTPIHHDRLDVPPVIVTTKISQGVVAGYFRPKDDPSAEAVIAFYYDGTHHDTSIPGASYQLFEAQPGEESRFSAADFEKKYVPAEVGYVVPQEALPRFHHHGGQVTHAESEVLLRDQEFEELAAEFDFPVQPRVYAGSCEHSVAKEQLKDRTLTGIGHFVPCPECGQTFEFYQLAPTQAAS